MTKNIFLCGFMGCGKSTVGLELASLLNMKFVDMDSYIEKSAGKTVREIFEKQGECGFRSLEHKAACELSKQKGLVVATGGGAVLSDENVDVMKSGGVIVFIDVPLEIIAARLEGDATRPLLQRTDKLAAMRSLYDERMPAYRACADYTAVNPDNRPEALVAREIVKMISKQ